MINLMETDIKSCFIFLSGRPKHILELNTKSTQYLNLNLFFRRQLQRDCRSISEACRLNERLSYSDYHLLQDFKESLDYQSYLYLLEELASPIYHRTDIANAEKGEHVGVKDLKGEKSNNVRCRQNAKVMKNVNELVKSDECVEVNECVEVSAKKDIKKKTRSSEIRSCGERKENEQRRMMYLIQ